MAERGCSSIPPYSRTATRRGASSVPSATLRLAMTKRNRCRTGRARAVGGFPGPLAPFTGERIAKKAIPRIQKANNINARTGERCLDMAGATGSIPVAPTIQPQWTLRASSNTLQASVTSRSAVVV